MSGATTGAAGAPEAGGAAFARRLTGAWRGRREAPAAAQRLEVLERGVAAAAAVVAGQPSHADAWLTYAELLRALGDLEKSRSRRPSPRHDDALRAYERAAALGPRGRAAALEGAGATLLSAGRPEEALGRAEDALALDPQRHGARATRARALAALGRPDPEAPASPLAVLAAAVRPLLGFVWRERRSFVLTAVLYVLGLVVWSATTATRDLGLRASTDPQILLAGLAPALVLAVALVAVRVWWRIPAWTQHRLLGTRLSGWAATTGVGALSIAVTVGGVVWISLLERVPTVAWAAGTVALATIVSVGLVSRNPFFDLLWYVYGALGFLLLAVLALTFYAETVYPRLPQSFGGGKPRCAQLDLVASSVSPATLAALAPRSDAQVVRTHRVDVVFSQGDVLVVRRPGGGLVELRSGSVRAIAACA